MSTYTEIGSEAEPAQVGRKQPSACRIDLTPDVGKVTYSAAESEDVDGGRDRSSKAEVQRCPDEVKSQLNRVQRCSLLS